MKKLCITLTLSFIHVMVWANGVNRDEAIRIAERFFSMQTSSAESSTARRAVNAGAMTIAYTLTRNEDETALYVINRGNNGGFVVVSGYDDTNYPILGWSDNGTFDYDKAPVQLKDLLKAYSHAGRQRVTSTGAITDGLVELADGRMANIVNEGGHKTLRIIKPLPVKQTAQSRVQSVPNIVVHPLVKVQWNQTGEYAKYIDPYYDSFAGIAAGCTPTAMAQIMAFWKYPACGRGFHMHNIFDAPANINIEQLLLSYATGQSKELETVIKQYSHQYKVNFGESAYQWNAMGGKHPATDAEIDNVAKLIFDCHVSCSPSKTPGNKGTGASIDVATASMIRYFGYSPDMQRIECVGNEDLMRAELDAGRPFLLEGYPQKGYDNEGHAFVCDGYAADGYFHFNFGWSGECDGYYLLSNINPQTHDYSANQHAYIGIQPSLATSDSGQAFVNVTPAGMGVVVGGYGDVVVPATVETGGKSYPVIKVKPYAFQIPTSRFDTWFEDYKKEYVTRITLPENIIEIGSVAFPSLYLTEVNLPASIRKIGVNAFPHSRELKKVSIPSVEAWLKIDFEPNKLENGFYQYKSNPIWNTDNSFKGRLYIGGQEATDIVIPASIKEIKPSAFCGYQFLNSVTIEEGVEKIGASAFERVPLKKLRMASTVKEIGNKAFYNHQLSTVIIPKGLTRIGSEALSSNNIAEYIVDAENPKYSSYRGALYDRARRTLVHCPNFRPGFKESKARVAVGVPSSVTSIRSHAFGNNLRKLTLPPSVRSIEDEAFVNTENLKDLYVYTTRPLPITTSTFHYNATSTWNKVKVHVPAGSGDAYRAAPVWQDMEIVEDQAEGSLPPEKYDYTTDYNAIEVTNIVNQNGTIVEKRSYYLFDTNPVITYSGTSMLITSTTGTYVFEKENYLHLHFQMRFVHYDPPTAIDDVKNNEKHVVIRTEGNKLLINGLDANTRVMLYSQDGSLLKSEKASPLGDVSIELPASDIIIVKAGSHSFKIHTKR